MCAAFVPQEANEVAPVDRPTSTAHDDVVHWLGSDAMADETGQPNEHILSDEACQPNEHTLADETSQPNEHTLRVEQLAEATSGDTDPAQGDYRASPAERCVHRRRRPPLNYAPDLFPFDYEAGRHSSMRFSVSRPNCLPRDEAKARLSQIFTMYGIESKPPEYLYSFTQAMLVAHALNGRGKAMFDVNGDSYSYGAIAQSLGQDFWSFFKSYADETAKALTMVLKSYNPDDHASVEMCGQIHYIAKSKNLVQYPHLIHDTADGCVLLPLNEVAAVLRSKNQVRKGGSNVK
ncbi:hypothetical protein O181_034150 [Austropuccinia psidii MF-1]|uniref:Uncharacterized protein n=1 Tax=Austropuccinia psidii MF-1 TaxID=1389203 RepID=A0A9Q3D4C0_9BASI|nr:hypothetical protein [Austropuccinia psidii MF-1]